MKDLVYRIFHPVKTKWFWLYIFAGLLLLILSIMLMPVWYKCPDWVFWKNWGDQCVNIIIALFLVMYLFFYLIKKIRRSGSGVIQTLCIIEFVLLAVIAAGCVLQQLQIIKINGGACAILGIALWCRGVVEIFRAYYHRHGNNDAYPVWWLVVAIFLVSFGVYIFVKPFFTNTHLLWFFVVLLILISIILLIDGFIAKPEAKKSKKEKKEKKESNSDKEEKQ